MLTLNDKFSIIQINFAFLTQCGSSIVHTNDTGVIGGGPQVIPNPPPLTGPREGGSRGLVQEEGVGVMWGPPPITGLYHKYKLYLSHIEPEMALVFAGYSLLRTQSDT